MTVPACRGDPPPPRRSRPRGSRPLGTEGVISGLTRGRCGRARSLFRQWDSCFLGVCGCSEGLAWAQRGAATTLSEAPTRPSQAREATGSDKTTSTQPGRLPAPSSENVHSTTKPPSTRPDRARSIWSNVREAKMRGRHANEKHRPVGSRVEQTWTEAETGKDVTVALTATSTRSSRLRRGRTSQVTTRRPRRTQTAPPET